MIFPPSFLLPLILALDLFPGLLSQVCSDVYPHLSCGLTYSTQEECEAVGCCWDNTVDALNPCYAPKINGLDGYNFYV